MFRPRIAALGALIVGSVVLAACDQDVILPGVRFPVRAPLEASIPVDGQSPAVPPDAPANQTRPISLPAMVANADWTQRGGNALHDSPHGRLSAAPQLIWATPIGSGNSRRNRITASPVVAGGAVFAMDAVARVTAVSLSGAALWQADLTAPFDRGGAQSGGGLAAAGGRVFATTGYGEVVALNASTGAVVWRQRLGSPAAGAPGVSGDGVFVMSADGTGWSLSATSGKILWTLPAATNVLVARKRCLTCGDGGQCYFPVLGRGDADGVGGRGPAALDGGDHGQPVGPGLCQFG